MAKRYYPHGKLKATLKVLIIFLVLIIIYCAYLFISSIKTKTSLKWVDGKSVQIDSVTKEVEIPEDITINLAVIGDIMCHNSQYIDAYQNGIYDFSYVFDDIKDELSTADFAVRKSRNNFCWKRERI